MNLKAKALFDEIDQNQKAKIKQSILESEWMFELKYMRTMNIKWDMEYFL